MGNLPVHRTPEGLERMRKAKTKHGYYTYEAIG